MSNEVEKNNKQALALAQSAVYMYEEDPHPHFSAKAYYGITADIRSHPEAQVLQNGFTKLAVLCTLRIVCSLVLIFL